jgi:hypothetical protein
VPVFRLVGGNTLKFNSFNVYVLSRYTFSV